MLIVDKVTPQIILLSDSNKENLAPYFARFQEHYESPQFRNQIFTLGQLRQYYSEKNGASTYNIDWIGYNFPSFVVDPFTKGLFDPLTDHEKEIVNLFRYRTDKFYIIGTNDTSAIDHEICHALFYVDDDYKNQVTKEIDKVRKNKEVKAFLHQLAVDYNESVLDDELHAYHAEKYPHDQFNGVSLCMPLRLALTKIKQKFYKKHGIES